MCENWYLNEKGDEIELEAGTDFGIEWESQKKQQVQWIVELDLNGFEKNRIQPDLLSGFEENNNIFTKVIKTNENESGKFTYTLKLLPITNLKYTVKVKKADGSEETVESKSKSYRTLRRVHYRVYYMEDEYKRAFEDIKEEFEDIWKNIGFKFQKQEVQMEEEEDESPQFGKKDDFVINTSFWNDDDSEDAEKPKKEQEIKDTCKIDSKDSITDGSGYLNHYVARAGDNVLNYVLVNDILGARNMNMKWEMNKNTKKNNSLKISSNNESVSCELPGRYYFISTSGGTVSANGSEVKIPADDIELDKGDHSLQNNKMNIDLNKLKEEGGENIRKAFKDGNSLSFDIYTQQVIYPLGGYKPSHEYNNVIISMTVIKELKGEPKENLLSVMLHEAGHAHGLARKTTTVYTEEEREEPNDNYYEGHGGNGPHCHHNAELDNSSGTYVYKGPENLCVMFHKYDDKWGAEFCKTCEVHLRAAALKIFGQ